MFQRFWAAHGSWVWVGAGKRLGQSPMSQARVGRQVGGEKDPPVGSVRGGAGVPQEEHESWEPADLALVHQGTQASVAVPFRTQHMLGTAVGATLLAGPGPSPEWGGGGTEPAPSGGGVTCFMGSLSASMGFIGRWAPMAFTVTLLRKSGPRGQDEAVAGMGQRQEWLFAWQGRTWGKNAV